MIIKKYLAKSKEEALETAKAELGEGFVVMNVREIKPKGIMRLWKENEVEVTVALEEETESINRVVKNVSAIAMEEERRQRQEQEHIGKHGIVAGSENIERKLDSLQNLIENHLGQETPKGKETTEAKGEASEEAAVNREKREEKQEKFEKVLYNTLIDNEVDEKYINQIYNEVEKGSKPGMPFDYFLAGIYQKMILKFGKSEGITASEDGPRVILFIGPTGVGKTTTIAKLAGKLAVEEKKKVALLTADTFRIAAAEQLRTYAGIMEVPFRVVYTKEEFSQALDSFQGFDYVFVDTAGHSDQNAEKLGDMKELISVLDGMMAYQCFLVLSATTKYKDLVRIVENYRHIAEYELIFTKLDETSAYGNLLNISLLTGKPLAYITCGQNVPNDIKVFDPQNMVKILLGGKKRKE